MNNNKINHTKIIYANRQFKDLMQEQPQHDNPNSKLPPSLTQIPNDFQIIQMIKTTFQSKTTSQVSSTQSMLNKLLEQDAFIERLLLLLYNEQIGKQSEQFKISVCILIKRFSYQYSKRQHLNKQPFLEKLFCLIISHLPLRAKQQLGTALQYILNHQQDNTYKPKVILKVTQILQSQQQHHFLQGALIICTACLNSLIEVDEQFDFLWGVFDSLVKHTIGILELLKIQGLETMGFADNKRVVKLAGRVFEFMELGISRVMEQQDLLQDKVQQLRFHPSLQLLFFSYLSAFSVHKSILSSFSEINSVKSTIVEIIFHLYRTRPMSQNLFNLFFITLLLQSEKQTYEQQQQHIITRVMELLQDYLQNKFFIQTFSDHKMQMLMSMFAYCVTKPQEVDMIDEEPERFVELAEEFTEGFRGSTHVKVRAASFLKVFISKFDQAIRNILQVIVIIITAYLQSDDPQSPCLQLYNNLKTQFSSMIFFNLDPILQVETSLNILSLLSTFINKRDDLKKVVYALFISHFEKLQKIQQPIIILRLIRTIGYYPTALYYTIIKNKMAAGKTFVLEGLKAFECILKANRYPEIFDLLSQIFAELITVMNVNDHIFQTIILNHYQRILKKNLTLYNSFLMKIRDSFIQNLQKNPHCAFTCLGYMYSILNKQNESSYRHKIMQYFIQMQQFYNKAVEFYQQKLSQHPVDSPNYKTNKHVLNIILNYQDKIIDIYSILVKKQSTITPKMVQFSINKLRNLSQQNRNAEIFKLYNNLFLKVDSQFQQIILYYDAFMHELRNMFSGLFNHQQNVGMVYGKYNNNNNSNSGRQNLDILPNLSYLISQIFACFNDTHLKTQDIQWIMKDLKQYLLLIILTQAYAQPIKLKQLLQSMNLYEVTLKHLLTTNYTEALIRKIFLLAMSKLLEIQQNYFQDILRQCISYLNEQYRLNEIVKKKKEYVDPKMRRILGMDGEQEEEMVQEKAGQKNRSTCCVPEFKHPYSALSEYDQFKIRIWHNSNIIQKLSEKDKNDLREILQMDWIGRGVRKIVSVKQEFV